MNELSVLSALIGLVVLVLVVLPFFRGPGGWLLDASNQDSVAKLREKQKIILERWLADEEAAKVGHITAREWSMRQVYLTNRYVDTTRRIEWLTSEASS